MKHALRHVEDLDDFSRYRCEACGGWFRLRVGDSLPEGLEGCGEPLKEKEEWDKSMPSRGLGDTVAKAINRATFGLVKPCGGCKKRQEKLNRWLKYQRPSGLVSPRDQWCIQVEVTNYCPRSCSNCTRHCPHVKDPFFMDLDTFERAVKSMEGYEGMLGIQGGEPTLHPQFGELVEVYDRLWHPREPLRNGLEPIADFGAYHAEHLADNRHRRGLWSALGPGYRRHYERIMEVFDYQCLNDHDNPARHAPLLVDRRYLGVPDDEWAKYRDRCWVQREWSSSITPKGCFPCEIMASLDALTGGPGGWPIEPGWWKREPADFGSMLDWCEMCSACLPLTEREAREGLHDVSPVWLERLQGLGSPALGECRVYPQERPRGNRRRDADWYMPKEWKRRRVNASNPSTKVRGVEAVVVCVDRGGSLAKVLPRNAAELDRIVVVTASHDRETMAACDPCGNVEVVVTDACYEGGDAFNKGRMLNAGLARMEKRDWCLNLDADIQLPPNFCEKITAMTLNPGCLYYTRRRNITDGGGLEQLRDERVDFRPWGYFQLWNPRAKCLEKLNPLEYPDTFCSAGNVDTWWQFQWPRRKRMPLPCDEGQFDVGHVAHGKLGDRWNGDAEPRGWRYVGQSNFTHGANGYRHLIYLPPGVPGDTPLRAVEVSTGRAKMITVAEAECVPGDRVIWEYQYRDA